MVIKLFSTFQPPAADHDGEANGSVAVPTGGESAGHAEVPLLLQAFKAAYAQFNKQIVVTVCEMLIDCSILILARN